MAASSCSGVSSDMPKCTPCVSVMLATSKLPAPAQMMVLLGASSHAMTNMAGTTAWGSSAFKTASGIKPSVMRVAAVGAKELTRILYFSPSMAKVCIMPAKAILAAP